MPQTDGWHQMPQDLAIAAFASALADESEKQLFTALARAAELRVSESAGYGVATGQVCNIIQ